MKMKYDKETLKMKILKLSPTIKDYIWGGTRLREEFGKIGGNRLAESWVLSFMSFGRIR